MIYKSHINKTARKMFIESKNVDMLKNFLKITSTLFTPNFFNFKNITGHHGFRNINNIIFIINAYLSITTFTN